MSIVQRVRVPLGFVFAVLYLYFARPRPVLLGLGLAVALVGLGIRFWASGHLEKGRRLAVAGPYRWTRNPLYLGSFVMGLGFCLAASSPLLILVFVVLYPAVYIPVMKREEGELLSAFGRPYDEYRQAVPFFAPWRLPRSMAADFSRRSNFQWRRVISNREYNALIGFLLVTALTVLKMLWL